MIQTIQSSIADHFGQIKDPRDLRVDHLLIEIITIAICAVICGADNWVEIEQFGQAKEKWLRKFLILPKSPLFVDIIYVFALKHLCFALDKKRYAYIIKPCV